ncbi:hypothetical protein [Pseudohaliea rubra]|uniref:Uncharacterized protein n=1 Tax=Pseudohaliea rubra DSM 19751 TaxID=1265313 RepID=A0A095VU20_9GAMM|nr:hypothetical protein [Pseudohaliea rubra]KGE04553.1 hypothetical protein HRUBRA_00892 [Pseudohaliea rubra DSM 19751]
MFGSANHARSEDTALLAAAVQANPLLSGAVVLVAVVLVALVLAYYFRTRVLRRTKVELLRRVAEQSSLHRVVRMTEDERLPPRELFHDVVATLQDGWARALGVKVRI